MHLSGLRGDSGTNFEMMGVSSGVRRASIIKAINYDEGDDRCESGEVLLEVLLAGCFLEGTRSDAS
jgi:hypothetical protein